MLSEILGRSRFLGEGLRGGDFLGNIRLWLVYHLFLVECSCEKSNLLEDYEALNQSFN